MHERAGEVLDYWFRGVRGPATEMTTAALRERLAFWFSKNAVVDAYVRDTFGADVERAARGEYDAWAETPHGTLALVVLLDQFPRNMFRDDRRAFENDPKAFALAHAAILRDDVERALNPAEKFVMCLPLMHAESKDAQHLAVAKIEENQATAPPELAAVLARPLEFAKRHAYIVDRFGRMPHRNAVLGRETTDEEAAFLKEPNSSF